MTSTFVAYAAAQGVRIDELRTELEGDIDLRAALAAIPGEPMRHGHDHRDAGEPEQHGQERSLV